MVARLVMAAFAAALITASPAGATPGVVDAQSGSTVDRDGTQGDFKEATDGNERPLTTAATKPLPITSDACAIIGKGCMPPSSFDPRTISATTGVSDDPGSALDPDGFQADKVR